MLVKMVLSSSGGQSQASFTFQTWTSDNAAEYSGVSAIDGRNIMDAINTCAVMLPISEQCYLFAQLLIKYANKNNLFVPSEGYWPIDSIVIHRNTPAMFGLDALHALEAFSHSRWGTHHTHSFDALCILERRQQYECAFRNIDETMRTM